MLRIPRIAGPLTIRLRLGFVVAGCIFVGCFLAATPAALASTPSFQVKVPHKTAPQMEVFTLKITVSVTTAAGPVTFTVTPPGSAAVAAPALSPGSAPTSNIALNGDVMKIFSPSAALAATNPLKRKYLIVINLLSNVNPTTCASSSPAGADETWTIAVSGAEFDGACVQTLDKNAGGGVCMATFRTVPPNDGATPSTSIATILGADGGPSELGCRPGVDAVLVLDRSGSMDSPVLGGPDPNVSKLTALKSAVSNFMTTWKDLRANEANTMQSGNPNIASPTDRVGVAFFDSSNPAKWLKELDGTSTTVNGMNVVSDAIADDIASHTQANIVTGGATSIGSGLFLADGVLTPLAGNGNRKVFLVMSDGMENSDKRTRVNPGDSTDVQTTQGAVATSLTNQPPAQIYALTIGSPGAINPTINQAIADASNGFYLNSEYDTTILSNFFLEVLQNAIKFATVETYRMVSSQASQSTPYTTTMPVTSTTTSLTFSVSWNAQRGALKLTVTPPGGSAPIVRTETSGSMVVNVLLQSGIKAGGGNWGIRIEPADTINTPGIAVPAPIPFNLIVLGDDTGVNADLSTISADYAPGDQIRLTARMTEIGEALTGLNTQAGATVVAELVRPDAGGIGDLLSSSNASTSQPTSPDQLSPVDAKLQNTLAADNDAIKRATNTIVLLDNGNAANGDATANDGTYSALFPAQIIGHHNFLFGIEGSTAKVGRFSRQQLRTVHVRAVPDNKNTTVTTTIQSGSPNTLVVNMTPETKFGNRLGPGWGNYFWVTGNGMSPMKFNDNMNGTYTASIPFVGNPPSDVKIHFERVNEYIGDTVTAGQLPIPLGNGTVVIPDVSVDDPGDFKHWGLSLHAGVSIPHGNFNTFFKPGPNVGVDLEYRFNQTFSAEAIYTYHRFPGEDFGFGSFFHLNVHQFSINGKVYGSSSPVRPFFNFGGGVYVFTPGVSTHGGLNVGGGLQFDVTPNIAIDAMYNFHNVFTSGSDTKFSAVQGGVRFRF